MKDGAEGDTIASKLEQVEVGVDENGEEITSCIVVPADLPPKKTATSDNLSKNQRTMFSILHDAGRGGLTTERWYELAREAGIGLKRKADLTTSARR